MPRTKKFADKKSAQTFNLLFDDGRKSDGRVLVAQSGESDRFGVHETQFTVDSDNEDGLWEDVDEDPDELPRQQYELGEYGFPDDGYDYSQHLREIDQNSFVAAIPIEAPRAAMKRKKKQRQEEQVVTFKEDGDGDGEEGGSDGDADTDAVPEDPFVAALGPAMQTEGLPEDVLALLEGDVDVEAESAEGELEDDFVAIANEGRLEPVRPKGKGWDDGPMGGMFLPGMMDPQERARLAEYLFRSSRDDQYNDDDMVSMTSSAVFAQRVLDQQFDHLMEEYDDDDLGSADEAEFNPAGIPEERVVEALEEFVSSRTKEDWFTVLRQGFRNMRDDELRAKDLGILVDEGDAEFHDANDDDDADLIETEDRQPDEQWDCETVHTAYSSFENQPASIKDESDKPRKIKLSSKTGIPLGVLPVRGRKADGGGDDGGQGKIKEERGNQGEARQRGETAEERRQRKAAVKEQRRAARAQKKEVRQDFKEQGLQRSRQKAAPGHRVSTIPLGV